MQDFITRSDLCSLGEVRALSRRSNAKGALQLTSHLLATAGAVVLVWASDGIWWLLIPAWIVLGVLIAFLFCPLHETIHRTAFATRWINDVLAQILGFVVLLPSHRFRYFHYEHHRHTHVQDRDPELTVSKPRTRAGFVLYLTGFQSFWWVGISTIAKHAAGRVNDDFVPSNGRAKAVAEARLYLLGYMAIGVAALATGSWLPLMYWLVPLAFGTPFLRLYLLAEHTLLPHSGNMLRNSRTIRTHAVLRWLAWRMPFHTEHHVFPSIPFHALEQAYRKIAPRHGELIDGYFAFFVSYWRSLKPTSPTSASPTSST